MSESLHAPLVAISALRRDMAVDIYRLDYEERTAAATKKPVNRPPKLRHSGPASSKRNGGDQG
jgi:hypothetical protein